MSRSSSSSDYSSGSETEFDLSGIRESIIAVEKIIEEAQASYNNQNFSHLELLFVNLDVKIGELKTIINQITENNNNS